MQRVPNHLSCKCWGDNLGEEEERVVTLFSTNRIRTLYGSEVDAISLNLNRNLSKNLVYFNSQMK